jgi:hypothetical protein
MSLSLSNVVSSIYECEENCSLSSDWDGGWYVAIGGSAGTPLADTWVANVPEATRWLHEQALARFPEYSKRHCSLRRE